MADAVPVVPGQIPSASLYVCDLALNVSNRFFYELFNSVAPVVSYKICRDRPRRQSSLCHAFVNFQNIQDATNALNRLSFTKINGNPIRIMFFPHSVQRNADVYVENLDLSIDNVKLYTTFATFGPILSCEVVTDNYGNSKGYGYVQFENEVSAQTSIESLNGMRINFKQIYVVAFARLEEGDQGYESLQFVSVYVKNLPKATTIEDLEKLFGPFGAICRVVVNRDKDGSPRCYGFVEFESSYAAADAVLVLNGSWFGGRIVYVQRCKTKAEKDERLKAQIEQQIMGQPDANVNLYVKNLDESVDEQTLKELFSQFGTVTSCKVRQYSYGFGKGYGLVSFSTPRDAMQAVNEMDKKMIGSHCIRVSVAYKAKRIAQLQTQNQTSIQIPRFHHGTSGVMPPPPPPPAAYGFPWRLLGMSPGAASNRSWVQGQLPLVPYPHVVHRAQSHHHTSEIPYDLWVQGQFPFTRRNPMPHPPEAHPAQSHRAAEIPEDYGHGSSSSYKRA